MKSVVFIVINILICVQYWIIQKNLLEDTVLIAQRNLQVLDLKIIDLNSSGELYDCFIKEKTSSFLCSLGGCVGGWSVSKEHVPNKTRELTFICMHGSSLLLRE